MKADQVFITFDEFPGTTGRLGRLHASYSASSSLFPTILAFVPSLNQFEFFRRNTRGFTRPGMERFL